MAIISCQKGWEPDAETSPGKGHPTQLGKGARGSPEPMVVSSIRADYFKLAKNEKSYLLPNVNRRTFLRTGATAAAVLFAAPAWCAEAEPSPPPDTEILASAKASIERHRKGDATLNVVDASGRPAPGTKITIEQQRHDFLFGGNLFLFARCGDSKQEDAYRERFAALFNYGTLGFYWAAYEPFRGKPNYEYTDAVLEWTAKQGITCKGHPLVWDHPAGSPRWLPDDPEEIAQLTHARVKDIVSRYRRRIDLWDVVNEATHLADHANKTKIGAWGAALGPVAYTAESLKIARAAGPDATLLVNDYRTDAPYYGILSRLRDDGKSLFDVVGIQSHMHDGIWPLHRVYGVCQQYAKLGAPIHFTETTILSGTREKDSSVWGPTTPAGEADQAEHVASIYTTLFAHPSVQAITWWDCSDYHAWQSAPAGLLRSDMSPKPGYERLLKMIKGQWWTKIAVSADHEGRVGWRGFYGSYRIMVEAPGGRTVNEVRIQRGQANQFTIRMRT